MEHRQSFEPAYVATNYEVDAPREKITIRIGEICAPLDRLLSEIGATTWAYLTACNPRSQVLPDDVNGQRMQDFEEEIASAGFVYFRGQGVGHADWKPEPSFLILNIDEGQAQEWADKYEQHAFVFGRILESARLVWVSEY